MDALVHEPLQSLGPILLEKRMLGPPEPNTHLELSLDENDDVEHPEELLPEFLVVNLGFQGAGNYLLGPVLERISPKLVLNLGVVSENV